MQVHHLICEVFQTQKTVAGVALKTFSRGKKRIWRTKEGDASMNRLKFHFYANELV